MSASHFVTADRFPKVYAALCPVCALMSRPRFYALESTRAFKRIVR